MVVVLDKIKDGYAEYNAIFVDPQNLAVLNNDIAMSILKEMTIQPMCAMDLARKLEQHEQKVYYHLNKLQKAGLIKLVGTEKRYGMVAQLYDLVSPVIAAKLDENIKSNFKNGGDKKIDAELASFFEPFVQNGKLDALIVIGNTQPHGRYNEAAREGPFVADLAMILGNMVDKIKIPCYKFDTQVKDNDLYTNNLILIGNSRTNVIVDKINNSLPIYFDSEDGCTMINRDTGKKYSHDNEGVIMKINNPFNTEKRILVLGGKRNRGARAAILAITSKIKKLFEKDNKESFASVVVGYDKDADYEVDDVEFVE